MNLRFLRFIPWVITVVSCGSDDSPRPSPTERPVVGLDTRPPNATCRAHRPPPSNVPAKWTRVYEGVPLTMPTMMAQIPGDGSRWYVTERGESNGVLTKIVSFSTDSPGVPTVAATIGPVEFVTDGEGGLLGLAFHPRFNENGRLYVSYVTQSVATRGRSVIAYLTSTDGGATFGNLTEVLSFDQPFGNHKGGGLAFGKDGYLYASFGDGRYPGDHDAHGQRLEGMFSKVVRIDVDVTAPGTPYGIPVDNPFAAGGGEPATFAWGFRNPFRLAFDRKTGDLWLADVGEDTREEINLVTSGGNYGWPCREGTLSFRTLDSLRCPDPKAPMIDPIFEHDHNGNPRSITGGVVYRGTAVPALEGSYIYGDFISQELFALDTNPVTQLHRSTLMNPDGPTANWVHFAEDQDGELYALAIMQGSIFKMVPADPALPSDFPQLLSETGCVLPDDPKQAAPGLVPYDVNAPLWSDGAEKQRWVAIPDDRSIRIGADGDFDLPIGSVAMKSFSIHGRLVETRLIMRDDTGAWAGYSYEWNDAQTDAALLPGGKTKLVEGQSWVFPSRTECGRCHTDAAGYSLGLEVGQLNRDLVYPDTGRSANQLTTLASIGVLDAPADTVASGTRFPNPLDEGPLDERARAYLHSNCSSCHRPEGGARGSLDFRFSSPLTGCNAPPEGSDIGIEGVKVINPGDPLRSLISVRMHRRDFFRMPPLGTAVADTAGVAVIDGWIASMTGCPDPTPTSLDD